MEPQLTHLETPIWGGHLTSLTYFLPFLSVPQVSPTGKGGVSLYVPKKHRQQRDFVLSVMKAVRASGNSGECLGKEWDPSWVCLAFISCSLFFRPI